MFGLTLLSMIFSYAGLAGCQFLKVKAEETPGFFGQLAIERPGDMGFGFFNVVVYDSDGDKIGCLPYDKDVKDEYFSDSAWRAGRAFGTMTVMALTVAFFMLALVMLFLDMYKDTLWLALKATYVIAFLTNLFTFSVFAADICSATSCKAGPAGGLVIFNVFLLIFLIIMSWLVPPPSNPVFRLSEGPAPEEIAEWREVKEGDDSEAQGVETIANEERFMEYDKQEPPAMDAEEESAGEGEEQSYDGEERHETTTGIDETTTGIDGNVKITTEITPEGKKIVEVVTHPDGSKTVTTTIEALEDDDEDDDDEDSDAEEDEEIDEIEIVTC
jgi:hypothetical protein